MPKFNKQSLLFCNQKGVAHLLLLLSIVGLIAFVILTNTLSFKNNLFSSLFPKPESNALGPIIIKNNLIKLAYWSFYTPSFIPLSASASSSSTPCQSNSGFSKDTLTSFYNSPYDILATNFVSGYEICSLSIAQVTPVINLINNNPSPGKEVWPVVFLNRIYGPCTKNADGSYVNLNCKAKASVFDQIKGIELDNQTGSLQVLYDYFKIALQTAKQTNAKGIWLDHEAYNNYSTINVSYVANLNGISENTTKDKLRAIGAKLADITNENYPDAYIWGAYFDLPVENSQTLIVLGMLDQAKAKGYRFKFIEGSESGIGYLHTDLYDLMKSANARDDHFQTVLQNYPNVILAAPIAPYADISKSTTWIKDWAAVANPTVKTINDFPPLYRFLFNRYDYVWIYGASAAPYKLYDATQSAQYAPGIQQAKSDSIKINLANASLSFDQDLVNIQKAANLTMKVLFRSDKDPISSVDSTIIFDPRLVKVVSINRAGSFITNWTSDSFDNTNGKIHLLGNIPGGFKTNGSDATLTTINFQTLAAGSFKLTVDPYISTAIRATDNFNILTTAGRAQFNVLSEAPALKGDWKFNEATGTTAKDSSGNNNNGTLINSPSWTPGKFGNGLDFTSNLTSLVKVNPPPFTDSSSVTLECWVYLMPPPSGVNTPYQVCAAQTIDTTHPGYWLYINPSKAAVFLFGYPSNQSVISWSSSIISYNTWTHIAGTFDGSVLSIYVNGKLEHTSGANGTHINNTLAFIIGSANSNAQYHLYGKIDGVKLYNYAITQAQILSDMYNGAPPSPTPTIAPLPTPTSTPSSVPGDLNGDGHVDILDYGVFAGDFRDHNLRSDFNHDGVISVIDYGMWVDYYRQANGIH